MLTRARHLVRRRPGRDLVLLFALTILMPGVVLAAIAVRGLLTEHRLAAREVGARLDRVAAGIADVVNRDLSLWQSAVDAAADAGRIDPAALPASLRAAAEAGRAALLVAGGVTASDVWPAGAVAYTPSTSALAPGRRLPAALADAELVETVEKDYERAIALYRAERFRAADDDRVWLDQRLARTYRKAGRANEAAALYRTLVARTGVEVDGVPVDLAARVELCAMAAAADSSNLRTLARDLYGDLVGGRWSLEKPRYLYYADTTLAWLGDDAASAPVSELVELDRRKRALAEALASDDSVNGYVRITAAGARGQVRAAAAIAQDWLRDEWFAGLARQWSEGDLAVALVGSRGDVDGDTTAETDVPVARHALASAALPWVVEARVRDPAALSRDLARRRNLYVALLVGVVALLAFGAYATARIVRREVEVARMKSDFVSAVSHEFRSPLTGIRQLGEMLARGRVPSEARRQEYCERIVRESDRLTRVVENLLDFARMEEGRKEYRLEPVDPRGWLEGVAASFAAHASGNGHRLMTSIPNWLPPIVADREALTTAVDNLLDNAVKYSPEADTVWLEAEVERKGLAIRVRDAGVGISEADRSRIFERFVRGSGELARQVKGTGLGLSLVEHIVRAHGGRIAVDSEPGRGSEFTIWLPASREPAGTSAGGSVPA